MIGQLRLTKIPAIESRYADLAANYLEVLLVLEDLSSSHHHIHRREFAVSPLGLTNVYRIYPEVKHLGKTNASRRR